MSQNNIKYLFYSGLILSLSLHWIFYKCITITFNETPRPHKPKFVFLGSIFKKNEIMDALKEKSATIININQPTYTFGATDRPYQTTGIIKPKSDFVSALTKESPKSTFLENTEIISTTNTSQKALEGIDENINPYQPLKFR